MKCNETHYAIQVITLNVSTNKYRYIGMSKPALLHGREGIRALEE